MLDGQGAPVPGARVSLDPWAGEGAALFTDEDGRFAIEAIPAGRCTVLAEHPSAPPARATDVVAGGGEVHIRLQRESVVHGEVVTARGTPATSFSVRAYPAEEGALAPVAAEVRDARGQFELHRLAPGSYRLVATSAAAMVGQLERLALRAGETRGPLRVTVAPVIPLRGTVVDAATGSPLPTVVVFLEEDAGPTVQAFTDARGVFEFSSVLPGEATVALQTLTSSHHPFERRVTVRAATGPIDLGPIKPERRSSPALAPGP